MYVSILPRLYISNKDLFDARIQQSQAILNTQIQRAEEFASSKISEVKDTTKSYYQKKTEPTTKKDN